VAVELAEFVQEEDAVVGEADLAGSGRRTNLTRLAEAGAAPAVLQALAGHANVSTTMGYYVRVDANKVLDAAVALRATAAEVVQETSDATATKPLQ
jgi:integrase